MGLDRAATSFTHRLVRLDRALLALPARWRSFFFILTAIVIAMTALANVPREYADFTGVPVLGRFAQPERYGTDTVADMYQARVTLNDVRDMYTKRRVEQTPIEAATWSKEASAPYPPATLLAEAALFQIGEWTGAGFYGMVAAVAIVFLGLSARYFAATRWYLFPVLYLSFGYLGERFFHVQDGSYLILLLTMLGALLLARHGRQTAHLFVAAAITMKLSPLYYVVNLRRMSVLTAVAFVAILLAGFVLPYFVWENYLHIFRYNSELKGDFTSSLGALALAVPFAVVLRYVEQRRSFDAEDRVGWGLVPVALFLAFKMNAARHLLLVLLVPDKRGARNLAAAAALLVHALLPVPLNAVLPIATVVLIGALAWHLGEIGWPAVRQDFSSPRRLLAILAGG